MKTAVSAVFLVLAVFWSGCGSGNGTALDRSASKMLARSTTMDSARQTAMQHFIDGSVEEVKGDFAKAVLEFQDALRYDQDPAIYYALSKNYSLLGKHSLAIEAARDAVKRGPEEMTYRRNLAEIYVMAFEYDAAAEQFEEIIRRDSSQITAWYSLARLYQPRKPLRALEVYEEITRRFGPEWDVLLQTAEINNKLGKFDKAAEALHEMTVLDPANKPLKESLAQTYARAGKYDDAIGVYGDLRELYPEDLSILAEIAGVRLARGESAQALKEFDQILSHDSVAVDVKLHIGEMCFAQLAKDSTLAPQTRKIFERIAAKHPEDWRPFWFLGAVGSMMHDDSGAVRNFRRVTELASWNADAWVYLSSVFLGKNNFEEVARILESAVRILPDDYRVNFFLGISYSRLNRPVDAARVLERARQINPKEVDAIAQLALVYDGMSKFEESDALYEEALRLDPANALVLNNFAYSLAERNLQLDRALSMSRKAVDADPNNASYLDTIGWIFYRMGSYKEAEHYVKEAIGKGEVNAVVYEHLGDIYYRLNQKDLALEQWNLALKLDAGNAALRDKIARGSL
jgi:tetratricopeptide (TPR) repeat protein